MATPQHNEGLTKFTAFIAAVAAAAAILSAFFSWTVGDAQNEINKCLQRNALSAEVVELASKMTDEVNDEMGIPDVCYKSDGTPSFHTDFDTMHARKELQKDQNMFAFKIQPLSLTDSNIHERGEVFMNSLREVLKQCKSNSGFNVNNLYKAKSVAYYESTKFSETLGSALKYCYE